MNTEGERCQACGLRYDDVWQAQDDLWAEVTEEREGGGLRCMTCFAFDAEMLDIPISWVAVRGTTPALGIDAEHLERQREWSARTFGPGSRTNGVLDHIRKELTEIEADPTDLSEWVDVLILAFDGAWRAGWEPQQIIDAIKAKQTKNEARSWPDWRSRSEDEAIEHIREEA